MTADAERQNRIIVERLLHALDDLITVYRFGATARGTSSAASDADIAVLAFTRIPDLVRFELQEDLAAAIGRDVDLVDLRSA